MHFKSKHVYLGVSIIEQQKIEIAKEMKKQKYTKLNIDDWQIQNFEQK